MTPAAQIAASDSLSRLASRWQGDTVNIPFANEIVVVRNLVDNTTLKYVGANLPLRICPRQAPALFASQGWGRQRRR
jgi:hypothetical protein